MYDSRIKYIIIIICKDTIHNAFLFTDTSTMLDTTKLIH